MCDVRFVVGEVRCLMCDVLFLTRVFSVSCLRLVTLHSCSSSSCSVIATHHPSSTRSNTSPSHLIRHVPLHCVLLLLPRRHVTPHTEFLCRWSASLGRGFIGGKCHKSHITIHTSHITHHTPHASPGVSSNAAQLFRGQGDTADAVMGVWQAINFPASVGGLQPPRKRQLLQHEATGERQETCAEALDVDGDYESSSVSNSSDDDAEWYANDRQHNDHHHDLHNDYRDVHKQQQEDDVCAPRPVWSASSPDAAAAAAIYMSAASAASKLRGGSVSKTADELPVISLVPKGSKGGASNEDASFLGDYANDAYGSSIKANGPHSLSFWQRVSISMIKRLTSQVTSHTSHVTRHTSHVTRHTSGSVLELLCAQCDGCRGRS
jgi:hypothetical protein